MDNDKLQPDYWKRLDRWTAELVFPNREITGRPDTLIGVPNKYGPGKKGYVRWEPTTGNADFFTLIEYCVRELIEVKFEPDQTGLGIRLDTRDYFVEESILLNDQPASATLVRNAPAILLCEALIRLTQDED